MAKKEEKIFAIVAAVLLVAVLVFMPTTNNYMTLFLDMFAEPDWDKIPPRDIVKNSIPITVMESTNEKCMVSAKNFELIIDHEYFIRGSELANRLSYDREKETLILPCEMLVDKTSKLHIWYILGDAPSHSAKYSYFVTAWNDTLPK